MNESPIVIWTDVYDATGHRWNLTLRYPVSEEMAGDFAARLGTIVGHFQDVGFSLSPNPSSAPTTATTDVAGLPQWVTTDTIPQEGETHGYRLCNRVEIEGNRVAFYAANDRLEFPVLNVPDFQVREAIGGYEGDLTKLGWDKFQWVAEWNLSEKVNQKGNPYKDLVNLWKLEDFMKMQKEAE